MPSLVYNSLLSLCSLDAGCSGFIPRVFIRSAQTPFDFHTMLPNPLTAPSLSIPLLQSKAFPPTSSRQREGGRDRPAPLFHASSTTSPSFLKFQKSFLGGGVLVVNRTEPRQQFESRKIEPKDQNTPNRQPTTDLAIHQWGCKRGWLLAAVVRGFIHAYIVSGYATTSCLDFVRSLRPCLARKEQGGRGPAHENRHVASSHCRGAGHGECHRSFSTGFPAESRSEYASRRLCHAS